MFETGTKYIILEDLEAKLRNEWDQFRLNCLKEREDLYQTQVLALNRELPGTTVPTRVLSYYCRLINFLLDYFSRVDFVTNECKLHSCISATCVTKKHVFDVRL